MTGEMRSSNLSDVSDVSSYYRRSDSTEGSFSSSLLTKPSSTPNTSERPRLEFLKRQVVGAAPIAVAAGVVAGGAVGAGIEAASQQSSGTSFIPALITAVCVFTGVLVLSGIVAMIVIGCDLAVDLSNFGDKEKPNSTAFVDGYEKMQNCVIKALTPKAGPCCKNEVTKAAGSKSPFAESKVKNPQMKNEIRDEQRVKEKVKDLKEELNKDKSVERDIERLKGLLAREDLSPQDKKDLTKELSWARVKKLPEADRIKLEEDIARIKRTGNIRC